MMELHAGWISQSPQETIIFGGQDAKKGPKHL
jgi:hypothetical protein